MTIVDSSTWADFFSIVRVCLGIEAELLSPDADFARIAGHTGLRLWRP